MARALSKSARIGMWIGIIGGVVGGGIGLIVGVFVPMLTASGPMRFTGLFITIPMILIFALVFGRLYKKIIKPLLDSDKLLETGVQTPATLVKIWETGTMINNRPLIGMTIEVRPRFGAPYQVECKSVLGFVEISQYQPGAKLLVRVDPQDKNRVAVEGVDPSIPQSYPL